MSKLKWVAALVIVVFMAFSLWFAYNYVDGVGEADKQAYKELKRAASGIRDLEDK